MKLNSLTEQNLHILLNLMKEHPDLKVVPLIDSEILSDSEDCYPTFWLGSWGDASVDEVFNGDQRYFLKSDGIDDEELEHYILKNSDADISTMTTEQYNRYIHEEIERLPWEKVIVVQINQPN